MERERFRKRGRRGEQRLGKEFETGEWFPVTNKNRRFVGRFFERKENNTKNLLSLFVDNIPDTKDHSWLELLFSNYGIVRDVFIPAKRSKRRSKFGIVRYDCSVSAGIAIYRANGLEVEGNYLFVKKASFELESKRERIMNHIGAAESSEKGEDRRQGNMGNRIEEGKSYAQVIKGQRYQESQSNIASIQIQPIGNGWLYRSAIAKIRKLLSVEELEKEFRLEKVRDVQIRAIGARFVIITFPNEKSRNATIKERWVMKWFDEIKPWDGEQAKDERFVWLSCFGMPFNAWSMQTFKEIGGKWGHFLKVDDNTLDGKSYEKGKILIATEHSQKVEGKIELIVEGVKYIIRVEEEASFRIIESTISLVDLGMEIEKKDDDLNQNFVDVEGGSDDLEDGEDENDLVSNADLRDKVKETTEPLNGVIQSTDDDAEDIEVVAESEKGNELGFNERDLHFDIPINMAPDSSERHDKGTDWNELPLVNVGMHFMNDKSTTVDSTNSSSEVDLSIVGSDKGLSLDSEPVKNTSNVIGVEIVGPSLDQEKAAEDSSFVDEIDITLLPPVKAAINGTKRKNKRKTINDILGLSKVNSGNQIGGRNKQKCVVLRFAVAAVALSASISSDGIANRNRIILSEAQTIWEFNKMVGIGYDGDEDEVISKIAKKIAEDKDRASCQL